jgi:VIT1/CCC1 family predicted Fe2+/Mn2+ transporter/rubrerythrin
MSTPLLSRPPDSSEITRYRENLQAELEGAALYSALAEAEADPQVAEVYRGLAEEEEHHAKLWEERLRALGQTVEAVHTSPRWRTRLLIWLARRLGPQAVLPTVTGLEERDSRRYDHQPDARQANLPYAERRHAQMLRAVRGGLHGEQIARVEGRHQGIGGNALRAAVLGANDGLVSNLSLVMGVAGAQLSSSAILVTGLAGLLAGACSMALGEWLSVQSSRELYSHQIAVEAQELEANPEAEEHELALIYQAKGLSEEQAKEVAGQIMQDKRGALDTLVREELGVDPKELGGSAWEAAIASFLLFAVGAIIPVAPYFFLGGSAAVATSLVISAVGLFLIGGGITLVTRRSVLYSGMRQVFFGLAAAALTYGIGRVIGVAIAG